jgi:SAM-dependent methyltransferase
MTDLSALTERHAQVWSNGPFEKVADTISDLHTQLVELLAPQGGERWLDLGCGSGNVAELAARAGADVIGLDLSPRLIDVARERATAGGFDIEYVVGDAQKLPFADAAFDVVSSAVGIMFAPDQAKAAAELARVVRAGGRIGLASWTKEGDLGKLFAVMAPFQAPPPEGAGSPFSWGNEEFVAQLLGKDFELSFERRTNSFDIDSGDAYWELMRSSYGPTKSLVESLDPERAEELHRSWLEHCDGYRTPEGTMHQDREFLLVGGIRR